MGSSATRFDKLKWQRENRRAFVKKHGFSQSADYATDGLRESVLIRDGYACVACGMTDEEHRAKWNRPITVDHKDKNRKHNTMDNLQTLCLSCHGSKDLIAPLRLAFGPTHKKEILELRAAGKSYKVIADSVGLSIGTVYRWEQIWNKGRDIHGYHSN